MSRWAWVLSSWAFCLRLSSASGAPLAVKAPQAADSASRATLTWQAANEGKTYGYLVYRAIRREGPFHRINRGIVHVPEDGQKVHQYTFVDADVVGGNTYYYTIETVSQSGIKESFSGVVSKTVKNESP